MITVSVNGEKRAVPNGVDLQEFLQTLKLKEKSIVVELNHQVIDRKLYSSTRISENDVLEIVHFVGGG